MLPLHLAHFHCLCVSFLDLGFHITYLSQCLRPITFILFIDQNLQFIAPRQAAAPTQTPTAFRSPFCLYKQRLRRSTKAAFNWARSRASPLPLPPSCISNGTCYAPASSPGAVHSTANKAIPIWRKTDSKSRSFHLPVHCRVYSRALIHLSFTLHDTTRAERQSRTHQIKRSLKSGLWQSISAFPLM